MKSEDEKYHLRYKELLQNAAIVSSATFGSRILGYLRDMLQAFYLGTGLGADAFTMAFLIPNLMRRLTAEGSLTATFIPVFTRVKNNQSGMRVKKLASYAFYDLGLIVVCLSVIGIIFAPYIVRVIAAGYASIPGKIELTIPLLRIMFPYIIFVSLGALCSAIMNTYFKFAVPSSAPIFFNLGFIFVVVLFIAKSSEPAYVFAYGVLAGGCLQLLIQIPFVWKIGIPLSPKISFKNEDIRDIGKLMVPGIFGLGIFQINIALSRIFASLLADGGVAALYYATRISELILGLFAFSLSRSLFPRLSIQAAAHDLKEMCKTLIFSLKLTVFVSFPAFVGILLLSRHLITVLFERGAFSADSSSLTSSALVFLCLGLPFFSGNRILGRVFFSLKDTKTPVKVSAQILLFFVLITVILMRPLGIGGIALALSVSEGIKFGFYYRLLKNKIGFNFNSTFYVFLIKIVLCTGLMGIFIQFFLGYLDFTAASSLNKLKFLVISILGGGSIYFLAVIFLLSKEIKALRRIMGKRK